MMTTNTYLLPLLDKMDVAQLFALCLELDWVEAVYITDVMRNDEWYTKITIRYMMDFVEDMESILDCYS